MMTGRILHQDVVKQYAYYAKHRDSVIHLTISNQKIEGLSTIYTTPEDILPVAESRVEEPRMTL